MPDVTPVPVPENPVVAVAVTSSSSPTSPVIDVPVKEGPQGPKGDKGDTGAQGPQGLTGVVSAAPPLVYDGVNRTLSLNKIVNADIDDAALILPSKIAGTAVITTDSRLTNARQPLAHSSSHAATGSDPITPADIGAATAAQGNLAATAVQPGSLATVATTGSYNDLTGKPTLGSAAAASTSDFATAAQFTSLTTDLAGKVGTNDARLTDNRTPVDDSVTLAKLSNNSATVVANNAPATPKIGTMWVDSNDTVDTFVVPLRTQDIQDGAITGAKIASSIALSGVPTATTAAADTNTTQLATTEYVVNQGYLKATTAATTYQPLNAAAEPLYVQPTAPAGSGPYLWVQTQVNGDGWTLWIEDGT